MGGEGEPVGPLDPTRSSGGRKGGLSPARDGGHEKETRQSQVGDPATAACTRVVTGGGIHILQ